MQTQEKVIIKFCEIGQIKLNDNPLLEPQKRNTTIKKRSKINKFSYASSRRLKIKIIENFKKQSLYAVTLTLPSDYEIKNFKELKRVYFQKIKRRYDVYLIYRCELQKNLRPHIHFITNCDNLKIINSICDLWKQQFKTATKSYLTQCQVVETNQGYNYLVQHTSKHKFSQLGYKGRQWGEIGNNKEKPNIKIVEIQKQKYIRVLRLIRKKIKKESQIKSKLKYTNKVIIKESCLIKTLLNITKP